MAKNIYGLSRDIPEDAKQQVRQNSKFGCVVPNCRNAFYEYEHIIPEFKDAKEHDPNCICLVCPNHNPRRPGKLWNQNYSKEQILKYYAITRNSANVPAPKNIDFFSGFEEAPTIIIGKSTFNNTESIFNINGKNVFSFQKNQDDNPFAPKITFSGVLQDSQGNELFTINKNEWSSPTYHWDIKTLNGEIQIWDKLKKLVFSAIKIPQSNAIQIKYIDIWIAPFHVSIINDDLAVGRYSADGNEYLYLAVNGDFEHGKCSIYLNPYEFFDNPVFSEIQVDGNGGLTMVGNGIWLGRGGGRMLLRNIKVYNSDNIEKSKL